MLHMLSDKKIFHLQSIIKEPYHCTTNSVEFDLIYISVPWGTIGFHLLQADIDEAESDFRILVDARLVKYLTIDPRIYDIRMMYFGPTLFSVLPPLPPGD